MRFLEQALKILQVAEFGVDGVIIGDIIAEIDIRGRINWGEPDAIDTEVLKVVQVLGDAC